MNLWTGASLLALAKSIYYPNPFIWIRKRKTSCRKVNFIWCVMHLAPVSYIVRLDKTSYKNSLWNSVPSSPNSCQSFRESKRLYVSSVIIILMWGRGGALRDDTKNGCEGDYPRGGWVDIYLKIVHWMYNGTSWVIFPYGKIFP